VRELPVTGQDDPRSTANYILLRLLIVGCLASVIVALAIRHHRGLERSAR
jgi:hypothetical protein